MLQHRVLRALHQRKLRTPKHCFDTVIQRLLRCKQSLPVTLYARLHTKDVPRLRRMQIAWKKCDDARHYANSKLENYRTDQSYIDYANMIASSMTLGCLTPPKNRYFTKNSSITMATEAPRIHGYHQRAGGPYEYIYIFFSHGNHGDRPLVSMVTIYHVTKI